jgi:PKD repeat protein
MRHALRGIVLVGLFCFALSSALQARQWIVAQDGSGSFRTIQGAVNAASFGDTVYVSPGIYGEQVVVKDGVSIVGAGTGQTILRYTYGFDPVLLVQNASSARIESLSIERLPSILEGPVVLVESGSVAFADCIISGGQGAGMEVRGASSSAVLDRVVVLSNSGPGLWVHDSARVQGEGLRLAENEGPGLSVSAGSKAEISGSSLERNALGGCVVEDGELTLRSSELLDNAGWGLLLSGRAHLTGSGLKLTHNALGGLRLTTDAEVQAADLSVEGGGCGVRVEDRASFTLNGGMIHATDGDGVSISDTASASLTRLVVRSALGDGISAKTSGDCAIAYCTIVEAAADGVSVDFQSGAVEHNTIAYCGAAGLHVLSAGGVASTVSIGYNDLWANAPDYLGLVPRPTDLSVAPEFADLSNGNLALRPDSPLVVEETGWSIAGAENQAQAGYPATIQLTPTYTGSSLGEVFYADALLSPQPFEVIHLAVGAGVGGPTWSLHVESSLLGTWSRRTSTDGTLSLSFPLTGTGGSTLNLQGGFSAVLAGIESWARLWGTIDWASDPFEASLGLAANWPSTHLDFSLRLDLPTFLGLGTTVETSNLTLRRVGFQGEQSLATLTDGGLTLREGVTLVPAPEYRIDGVWSHDGRTWTSGVTFSPEDEAWNVRFGFSDSGSDFGARCRLIGGAFDFGGLTFSWHAGAFDWTAGLELAGEAGTRFTLGIQIDLSRWFSAPINLPPIPSFSILSEDPEAGRPIRFSAADARDDDGSIQEYLWDFGDGEFDSGETPTHTYTEAGTYDVALTIADDDGATATRLETLRIWPADTLPTAAFVASATSAGGAHLPRPIRAGDLIELDASESSDRDGDIAEYAWDLESDGVFDVTTAEPTVQVPALPAGSYPVTLRVTDDTGRSDAVMHILLVDRAEAPRAAYALNPPTPAVGDPIYFADQSFDSDGEIVSWTWDFGDGHTSRLANPTHRYESEGTYTVTLTVLDDDGLEGDISRDVDVAAIPSVVPVNNVWAVAIGISDYETVKDLQFGRDDAISFARWLLDSGIAPDQIRLLLDRDGAVDGLDGLVAKRATLVNVREALGWLRRVAQPDDLVLIQFSGHGYQGPDDDGDERDGVDEFFVLWDTVADALEDTALRDDEFGRFLDRLASQHVIVFFDGCYSGGLSRSLPSSARPVGGETDLFSDFSLEGKLVFAASAENQDAFESSDLGHGIFTYYLLQGLRGAADLNGDGRITAWELYEYVSSTVPARAMEEQGRTQQPQLTGQGEVRVLLGTTPLPPEPAFSYGPELPYAGGGTDFRNETTEGAPPLTYSWSFGDGQTSSLENPTHIYKAQGDFLVELDVSDTAGATAAATMVLEVGPPGRVLSVDADEGTAIISLGQQDGIEIGSAFTCASSSGAQTTRLVVIELLGLDAADCRVDGTTLPEVGDSVLPETSP